MANSNNLELPTHKDCLGRLLKLGDCVAVAHHNQLIVAKVTKLNPKMIKVVELGTKYKHELNKYSSECALLEGPDVSMYLLTHNPANH